MNLTRYRGSWASGISQLGQDFGNERVGYGVLERSYGTVVLGCQAFRSLNKTLETGRGVPFASFRRLGHVQLGGNERVREKGMGWFERGTTRC